MSNPVLEECAAHLAQDYWEQSMRIATRINADAFTVAWNLLSEADRDYQAKTMYSLLYRGVILCTRPEHQIKVSLRRASRVSGQQP